jgi:hypothetical protein
VHHPGQIFSKIGLKVKADGRIENQEYLAKGAIRRKSLCGPYFPAIDDKSNSPPRFFDRGIADLADGKVELFSKRNRMTARLFFAASKNVTFYLTSFQ